MIMQMITAKNGALPAILLVNVNSLDELSDSMAILFTPASTICSSSPVKHRVTW